MSKRPRLILCSGESASASAQIAQGVLAEAVDDDRPIYLLRLDAGSSELWRVPWWGLLRLVADELGGWPGGALPDQPPDPRVVPWLPGLDELLAALLASHLAATVAEEVRNDGTENTPGAGQSGDGLVVVDCGSACLRWLVWLSNAERAVQNALDDSVRTGRAGPLPTGMTLDPGTPSPAQLFVQMLRQARRDLADAQLRHAGTAIDAFLIELISAAEHGSSVTSTPESVTWQLPSVTGLPEATALEVGSIADPHTGLTRVVVCAGEQSITVDPPAALRRARLMEATLVDEPSLAASALLLHFTPDPQAW